MALQYIHRSVNEHLVFSSDRNERPAATDAFGIIACFFLRYADINQCADHATRGSTNPHAQERRSERTGRNHRTNSGDGQHSETYE
jgi:hypothetical protein